MSADKLPPCTAETAASPYRSTTGYRWSMTFGEEVAATRCGACETLIMYKYGKEPRPTHCLECVALGFDRGPKSFPDVSGF